MRSTRSLAILMILLLSATAWARQGTSPTTPAPAPKDPQAVAILNQALNTAGGIQAVLAIQDYTASGNITYNVSAAQNPQSSVTIIGSGTGDYRLDVTLPNGVSSMAVSDGTVTRKTGSGAISQIPPALPVPSSDAEQYKVPIFPSSFICPYLQLAFILQSPQFAISYKGVVTLDGDPVQDIQAYLVVPPPPQQQGALSSPNAAPGEYDTIDFFIDVATSQLDMVQDMVPKHLLHQTKYSNYQAANGVLIPYSISEVIRGRVTSTITLLQIKFNSGLSQSAFVLN